MGSPRSASSLDDSRIPNNVYYTRTELALDPEYLNSFLIEAVGQRYKGVVRIFDRESTGNHVQTMDLASMDPLVVLPAAHRFAAARHDVDWPDGDAEHEGDDSGSPREQLLYVNVTAASLSHSSLENALTLARINTVDGRQGLTLVSSDGGWTNPAQHEITVFIDVRPGRACRHIGLSVKTETLDIKFDDVSVPRRGDIVYVTYDNVSLSARRASILTGLLVTRNDISFKTGRGDLTTLGIIQSYQGSIRLASDFGIFRVGGVFAFAGDIDARFNEGVLIAQLLSAPGVRIGSDSAQIDATIMAERDVHVGSDSGEVALKVQMRQIEPGGQCRVNATTIIGSISIQFQGQPHDVPLFTNVDSLMGKIELTMGNAWEGDFTMSSRVPTNELLELPASKQFAVDRDETGGWRRLAGRVFSKEHPERGEPGHHGPAWGACNVVTDTGYVQVHF